MATLDISQITDQLYVAARPRGTGLEELSVLEMGLILCMTLLPPRRDFAGLSQPAALGRLPRLLWLPSIDHPLFPIPISKLMRGVQAALPVIERGESVVAFCRAGRHRSVAMCCVILIGLGYTAHAAMDLVTQRRAIADPHAPHIERVIRQFERAWARKGPG